MEGVAVFAVHLGEAGPCLAGWRDELAGILMLMVRVVA